MTLLSLAFIIAIVMIFSGADGFLLSADDAATYLIEMDSLDVPRDLIYQSYTSASWQKRSTIFAYKSAMLSEGFHVRLDEGGSIQNEAEYPITNIQSVNVVYSPVDISGGLRCNLTNAYDETPLGEGLALISGETIDLDGGDSALGFVVFYAWGGAIDIESITIAYACGIYREPTFKLNILAVNDLHAYIERDRYGKGGIANTAYLIDQMRGENPLDDTILIANGDMGVMSPSKGLAVVECMNAMRFDAMGIGNHELDYGTEPFLAYFDGVVINGEADFPLLNANMRLRSDHTLLMVEGGNVFESIIVRREGIRIGIISYIGNCYNSVPDGMIQDYEFDLAIADSAQALAADMRENRDADIIIVNIHDGIFPEAFRYPLNSELANLVDAHGNYLIDAIINGHGHHEYAATGTGRARCAPIAITQGGGNNSAFSRITLTIDTTTNEVVNSSAKIIKVSSAGANYVPMVQEIVDLYT